MDDQVTSPPTWGDSNQAPTDQAADIVSVAPPTTSAPAASVAPAPTPMPASDAPTSDTPSVTPGDTSGDAPSTDQATVGQAREAYIQALEARVAAFINRTYGETVLDEYLTLREKDDITALLMFEAEKGLNLDDIYTEQEAQLQQDLEREHPGSVEKIVGPVSIPTNEQSAA